MDKPEKNKNVDFESLVKHIQHASEALRQDARLVINRNVTTRAWLTGFYIVEYEQHGSDRAKYGDKLLKKLAERLNDKSFGLASLKNYRQFYLYYPSLAMPIFKYLQLSIQKSQTLFSFLQTDEYLVAGKGQTPFGFLEKTESFTNGKRAQMKTSV